VALPLLLASLTGALLVYGHEVQTAIDPDAWTVEPRGDRLSYDAMLARVAAQMPEVRVWSVGAGASASDAWTLWLADGAGVINLDPYTGAVLDHYHPHGTVHGILIALHRWWLVDGPARPVARHLISATALAVIAQVLLGLWLWWIPPRRWRNAVPEFRKGSRLAVLRLHQGTGLVTALLMLTVAFTGMALHWTGPARAVVEWVAAGTVDPFPSPESHRGLAPVADLEQAVALAESTIAGARMKHMRVPGKPGAPVLVALETPGAAVLSRAVVGDSPLRILDLYDGRSANAATWFWEIRYHLHMGDILGGVLKPLWVVLALLPGAFAVSGLWLHLRRRRPVP